MKTIALAVLVGSLLLGCRPGPSEDPYRNCEFRPGNLVRSKVTGSVGQVITMIPTNKGKWCFAHVRFPGNQAFTDSKVLSPDGPVEVKPLAVVEWMRPYELEHVARPEEK